MAGGSDFPEGFGRSVPKKGYIGPVSTKTHSGDPDGTGGFGGFLGSGRFLALKFRFYKKFHRQNWLENVGKQKYDPKKGYIGPVSTKTHSGDSDGTGGSGVSGGFPGPWP